MNSSERKELEADHEAIPRLIMHAAIMVKSSEIGSDGRTAYERSRGTPCRKELPMFGQCVFYRLLDRTGGRANKLGRRLGTNEMYIGTATGVVRGAAIKRKRAELPLMDP